MELQMQIELAMQILLDVLEHVEDSELHESAVEMATFLYEYASMYEPNKDNQ